MKRVAITGTKGGLGAALVAVLGRDYEILSLNRPGYDLDNINTFNDLEYKPQWDVFINCAAHNGYGQTELLYKLFEENQSRKCHIINVGSVSSDGDRPFVNEYAIQKTALEKASTQLSLVDSNIKVSLVKPGRMATPMTDHRSEYPRMNPEYVAETIKWMIDQPINVNIKSLTVDVMNANRKIDDV